MSMTRGKCSVDGCESGHYGRGLCRNHLYRFDRYGDPLGFPPKPTIAERFWPKVRKEPGGCWVWTANLVPRGYGHFSVDGKKTPAHRVAYQLVVGDIPEDLELDHVCHTNDKSCRGGDKCPHRRCVNPAHLEPVTHQENARRGRNAGRGAALRSTEKGTNQ